MMPFDPGDIWSYTNDPDAVVLSANLSSRMSSAISISMCLLLWIAK